jgi:hypothetical protein
VAIEAAFRSIQEAFEDRLRRQLEGTPTVIFCGVLAGALGGLVGIGAGAQAVFIPPAFGASAAMAAHRAPRASRSAIVLAASEEPRALEEVARILEEEVALAVEDLENNGVDRSTLAAVAWLEGADGAHGVYPVLDRAALRKAAEGIRGDAPSGPAVILSVEVYPAKTGEKEEAPPRLLSPLSAPATRTVVLPGERGARELRVSPAGALSNESPTRGPALLSDPTGLILVPEGFEARPAPLGGATLRRL